MLQKENKTNRRNSIYDLRHIDYPKYSFYVGF